MVFVKNLSFLPCGFVRPLNAENNNNDNLDRKEYFLEQKRELLKNV